MQAGAPGWALASPFLSDFGDWAALVRVAVLLLPGAAICSLPGQRFHLSCRECEVQAKSLALCLPWVAWGTNSDRLCELRHSMQLVVSPVMKGPNTDSLHRAEGRVGGELPCFQQEHNLQDPWGQGTCSLLDTSPDSATFSSCSAHGMGTPGEDEAQVAAVRLRINRCWPHLHQRSDHLAHI